MIKVNHWIVETELLHEKPSKIMEIWLSQSVQSDATLSEWKRRLEEAALKLTYIEDELFFIYYPFIWSFNQSFPILITFFIYKYINQSIDIHIYKKMKSPLYYQPEPSSIIAAPSLPPRLC